MTAERAERTMSEKPKTGDLTKENCENDKRPDERRKIGERGENEASRYLEREGYRILERNWRCRTGEIDIIAVRDGILVFVEVKTRRNLAYGVPGYAVTPEKRRHLLSASALYRHRFGLGGVLCRYDVIEILFLDGHPYLRHIRNAFS